MSNVTEQKKQKITIRLTPEVVRKLERYKDATKSELIQVAVEQWLERKDKVDLPLNISYSREYSKRHKRIKDNEKRCLAAFGQGDNLRCGLKRGHEGPHVFFCSDQECPGYYTPHTEKDPHPCKSPPHAIDPVSIGRRAQREV